MPNIDYGYSKEEILGEFKIINEEREYNHIYSSGIDDSIVVLGETKEQKFYSFFYKTFSRDISKLMDLSPEKQLITIKSEKSENEISVYGEPLFTEDRKNFPEINFRILGQLANSFVCHVYWKTDNEDSYKYLGEYWYKSHKIRYLGNKDGSYRKTLLICLSKSREEVISYETRKKELALKVTEEYKEAKGRILKWNFDAENEENNDLWKKLVQDSVDLHELIQPIHSSRMINARECFPDEDTNEFYNHFDSIKDLLNFIANPKCNNEPIDQTLGIEFKFTVYSRRWGHSDTYRITRNAKGWYVEHLFLKGQCDQSGCPYLFDILEHDSINYPKSLTKFMNSIWEYGAMGYPKEVISKKINKIAEWISICEKYTPKDF